MASGHCKETDDLLCASCLDALSRTRLSKSHSVSPVEKAAIHQPRQDASEGRR